MSDHGVRELEPDGWSDWPPLAAAGTRWIVDLSKRTVAPCDAADARAARWHVAGTAEVWQRVIKDGINLGLAFRRGEIRYRDNGDVGPASAAPDTRAAVMDDLLGITTWSAPADQAPSPVLQ